MRFTHLSSRINDDKVPYKNVDLKLYKIYWKHLLFLGDQPNLYLRRRHTTFTSTTTTTKSPRTSIPTPWTPPTSWAWSRFWLWKPGGTQKPLLPNRLKLRHNTRHRQFFFHKTSFKYTIYNLTTNFYWKLAVVYTS